METLEALRRKLSTTHDLRDIVSTMKTLSAVSINQFERSSVALGEYNETVRTGIKAVLMGGDFSLNALEKDETKTLAVVFGSDLGLVGRFNKEISKKAYSYLSEKGLLENASFIAMGRRILPQLENLKLKVDGFYTLPGAVKDISTTAMALLVKIERLCSENNIGKVIIFNNRKQGASLAVPSVTELLPISNNFVEEIKKEKWTTNQLPYHKIPTKELFAELIKEQILIWLCKACADSLASEYATRLATMQAAEKNIDEHIENLTMMFQQKRQDSITEELLDVVSGSEVLKSAERLKANNPAA